MENDKTEKIEDLLRSGLDLYGRNQIESAVSVWKKVLEIDPANVNARDYLSSAGFEPAGEGGAANGSATSAPDGEAVDSTVPIGIDDLVKSGIEQFILRQFTKACDDWAEALSINPDEQRAKEYYAAVCPYQEAALEPSAAKLRQINNLNIDGFNSENREEVCPVDLKINQQQIVELIKDKKFEKALYLLKCAAAANPQDKAIQRSLSVIENYLTLKYANILGGLDQIPELNKAVSELSNYNLNNESAYLLSLVDGLTSLGDILAISGLGNYANYRYVLSLLAQDLIKLKQNEN